MTGEHTSVIYGTHYPNRLFVGCLPPDAGAEDLGSFFATYGAVVEAKVVLDKQGYSKRFGFVTFRNADDVEALLNGKEVYFQGKKINVGPAVKKNMETTEGTSGQQIHPCVHTSKKPTIQQHPIQHPYHVAKTVIRKSPTEEEGVPSLDAPGVGENSFRSIWGISNQLGSSWAPLHNITNHQHTVWPNAPLPPSTPIHQHPFHPPQNSLYARRQQKNNQPSYSNALSGSLSKAPKQWEHI